MKAEGRLACGVDEILKKLLLLVHPGSAVVINFDVSVNCAGDFGGGLAVTILVFTLTLISSRC